MHGTHHNGAQLPPGQSRSSAAETSKGQGKDKDTNVESKTSIGESISQINSSSVFYPEPGTRYPIPENDESYASNNAFLLKKRINEGLETHDGIIRTLRQSAAQNGPITKRPFCRSSGIPESRIRKLFPGGWTELKQLAGVEVKKKTRVYTDSQLLEEYHRLATLLQKFPSQNDITREASFGAMTLRRRFGGKTDVVNRYLEWLNKETRAGRALKPFGDKTAHGEQAQLYGDPLNFRNMRHEPVNEQGVILLFGILSEELGFIIENVRQEFPDCESKRLVDKKKNLWRRTMIEFEYASSNFRAHRHDPAGADLIVCWIHDWEKCPVETMELKSELKKLKRAA